MTPSAPRGLVPLLSAFLLLSPAIAAADPLHRSGPPEDRVDLSILADGFKDDERADFDREAARVWEALRSTEPFASYLSFMNVSTGFRASPRSGPGSDNAYGTHFPKSFATLMRSSKMPLILADGVRAGSGEADVVLVIVKSPRRGGTAYGNVCFATTGAGPRTALHELGHSLGRLGDEYGGWSGTPGLTRDQVSQRYPNLTTAKKRADLPWKDWVASSTKIPSGFFTRGVGAYKGGGAYSDGVYRPRSRCRMRTDGPGFCEVCRQHLVLAFHQGSNPLRVVISGSGSSRRVKVEGTLPPGNWATRWNGVSGQGLEAHVPAGTEASVTIEDATPWVRGDFRSGVRYLFDAQTGQGGRVGGEAGRTGTVVGVTSRLRIREQPNTSSGVLGHLSPGATVRVVGPPNNGFYPIAYNGRVGYVGGSFVRLNTSRAGLSAALAGSNK